MHKHETLSFTVFFAFRFCIGFVTNYGLGAITLGFFDICVFIMRFWFVQKGLMTTLGIRGVRQVVSEQAGNPDIYCVFCACIVSA